MMKRRYDRVGFARAAIDNLAPWARERGKRHSEPRMPEYFELEIGGLKIIYIPSIKNLPTITRPRQVIDIYPVGGRKVFSVEWEPLIVIAFRPGPWVEQAQALWGSRLLH